MFLNQLSSPEKAAFISLSIYAARANDTISEREYSILEEYYKETGINFPVFNARFECVLPTDKLVATDTMQMKECTKQLQDALNNNPKMVKSFTPKQLEQIRAGEPRISGLTWHHNEEKGKMQLVDAGQHLVNKHIGGNAIWGSGKRDS